MTTTKELAYREMLRMLNVPIAVKQEVKDEFYRIIKNIIREYGPDMIEELDDQSLYTDISIEINEDALIQGLGE